FNRLDGTGTPSFAADSPTPLGAGVAANTAGLITVTPEERAELESTFHVVDSVRRWIAPYTGIIDITGTVALTTAGDTSADGVRATIQLEDAEIFTVTIADPTDLTPKPITGLTGVAVTAGQRLYVRVNSRNDGAFDTVAFDPTITYRTVAGAAVIPRRRTRMGCRCSRRRHRPISPSAVARCRSACRRPAQRQSRARSRSRSRPATRHA
ncbi:MAG: hypothetical protein HC834_02225, partial [Rhodospirillales bacterium]|nr:hypothetical protein [Rhodospirillales bacterium]